MRALTMGNALTNEPITAATVATVVTWLATRFGFDLSVTDATALAAAVMTIGMWFARTYSTPLARHDKTVATIVAATQAATQARGPDGA